MQLKVFCPEELWSPSSNKQISCFDVLQLLSIHFFSPFFHCPWETVSMYFYPALKSTIARYLCYSEAVRPLRTHLLILLCHCLTGSILGTGRANSELRLLPPPSYRSGWSPCSVANTCVFTMSLSSCFPFLSSSESDSVFKDGFKDWGLRS